MIKLFRKRVEWECFFSLMSHIRHRMCPSRDFEGVESPFIEEEEEEEVEEEWRWGTSMGMILWSTLSFLVPIFGLTTLAHINPLNPPELPSHFLPGIVFLSILVMGVMLRLSCVFDDRSHWRALRLPTLWGALSLPISAFYSAFLFYTEVGLGHLGISLCWTATAAFVHLRLFKYHKLPPGTMFDSPGPLLMSLGSITSCLFLGTKAGVLDPPQEGLLFFFLHHAIASTTMEGISGGVQVFLRDLLESEDNRRCNFTAWFNTYSTLSHVYAVSTMVAMTWPPPRTPPSYWSVLRGTILNSLPCKCLFKTQ